MDESQELEGSLEGSAVDKQFDLIIQNNYVDKPIKNRPRKASTPKAKLNFYEKKPPLNNALSYKMNWELSRKILLKY